MIARLKKVPVTIECIRYNYLTPIDKPTFSLALTSYQQLCMEAMQFSYIETMGAICPQVSVVAGAFMVRIGIQIICRSIREMKYKQQKQMQQINYSALIQSDPSVVLKKINEQRWVMKWIHKIFIIDSIRDYQFYNHNPEVINSDIRKYYRPGVLFASAINLYLSLNFLRGSHLLITSPQYFTFCASTQFLPNLLLHDPNFITPALVIPLAYWILRYSKHPLMINLNHKLNLLHCFNIAFMCGLALIPVPVIYHFSLIGLMLGHITIQSTKKNYESICQVIKKFINFRRKN